MAGAGGHQDLLQVNEIGVVGGQEGRQEGHHEEPQHQGETRHGHAVALETRPEFPFFHKGQFSVFSFRFSVKKIGIRKSIILSINFRKVERADFGIINYCSLSLMFSLFKVEGVQYA